MAIQSDLKVQPRTSVTAVKNRFGQAADILIPVLIFLWPFVYLYRDIFPIDGTYTAIVNDFGALFYKYKVYLLACLSEGHLPLWSPSEAAGFPFFSNPFAQVFYPLNILPLAWYKWFGGYTLLDHQAYTVLGLSIFALGLYCWLRQMIPNRRAVLFAVLIMSISFKMTEITRLTNAVHSAAWYPWILYAVTRLCFGKSAKDTVISSLILFFSVVCLCTAGYPYYVYYAIFLVPPYLVMLLAGFPRRHLFGNKTLQWKGLISIAMSGGSACILCAPYLIAIKRMAGDIVDRGGNSYQFAVEHIFDLQDTLGSLIYPPLSQIEGWYFFSITAILIITAYLFSSLKSSDNGYPPEPANIYDKRIGAVILLAWMIIISYISYGKYSYLFTFLWNYMPAFSSLRVWGRFNIILVPLLAWLLSLAYSGFEDIVTRSTNSCPAVSSKRSLSWFSFILFYFIILLVQILLYQSNTTDLYWGKYLGYLASYRIWFIPTGAAAFIIILSFLIFGRFLAARFRSFRIFMLATLVLTAASEMWPVGVNTWVEQKTPLTARKPLNIRDNNLSSFHIPRTAGYNTITLTPAFSVGTIYNWYYERYVYFLEHYRSEKQPLDLLLGAAANPQKIFVSQSLQHATIESFLSDSLCCKDTGRLISYNGDELIWQLDMPVNGYFSFIDNWDPYWKAYVDNKETQIELLFGTFKSVPLTQGKHQVIFRYEPTLRAILFGVKDQ